MPRNYSMPANIGSGLFIGLILLLPAAALSANGADVLEKMQQMQVERMEGVNAYSVVRLVAGQQLTEYYRQIDVEAGDGTLYPIFQQTSADAAQCSTDGQPMKMTP